MKYNITDIVCWIATGIAWLMGVVMCIAGMVIQGLLLILLAIFILSPERLGFLGKFFKNRKNEKRFRTAQNAIIITLVAAFVVFLAISGKNLWTRFFPSEGQSIENQIAEASQIREERKEEADKDSPQTIFDNGEQVDSQLIIFDNNGQTDNQQTTTDDESNASNGQPAEPLPLDEENHSEDAPQDESTDSTYLKIGFVDVGQGDCTMIFCDGEAMIIDAGPSLIGTSLKNYFGKERESVPPKTVKYLCLTHPDSDHIGSAGSIISAFDITEIWMPNVERDTSAYIALMNECKYKNMEPYQPAAGTQYMLGSAIITVLAPLSVHDDINNNSIVLRLDYNGVSFLFMGDAEEAEEIELIESGVDIDVCILKVGHHGSTTSSTESFIEAVSPSYAVISCAKGNDYGHPHEQPLNALKAIDALLYRTDLQGTVTCFVDEDGTISWSCEPTECFTSGWYIN